MEDYWAAYDDKTGEPQKIMERSTPAPAPSFIAPQMSSELTKRGKDQYGSRMTQAMSSAGENKRIVGKLDCAAAPEPIDENLIRKSSRKLIAASADVWMGTQILFIDILDVVGLLRKQFRGCKVPKREKKKIKRTFADFATLVPVIILMLLPIPSPYTSEGLGLVKQLKRIKKREFQQQNSIEYASSRIV